MAPVAHHLRWSLVDIPYDHIEPGRIAGSQDWFYLLAGASFVETLSDLYTRNLREYYRQNATVSAWLGEEWELEELQHGRALREYVLRVWPEFRWDEAYARFVEAYAPLCRCDLLGPTPALEMASRCVVETGTSSFYTMIQHASPEPVLSQLAARIRSDEVHHYKYFLRFFREYQKKERVSRWKVLRELWRRVSEADQEDSYLAVKCAYETSNPGQEFGSGDFSHLRKRMSGWVRKHYPFEMAVKMLLKPVALPPLLNRLMLPLLTRGARLVVAGGQD